MPSLWLENSIRDVGVHDCYDIDENVDRLGKGVNWIVRKGICRSLAKPFAVKMLVKQETEKQHCVDVGKLLFVKHPNILKIQEVFETSRDIHVVSELATGPKLFEWLANHQDYTELEIAGCIRDILSGVQFLHQRDLVHGSLKPENLFLKNDNRDELCVQLVDYSLHLIAGENRVRTANIFSAFDFTAPELMHGKPFRKPVDLWSVGVVTYILLCGLEPFKTAFELEAYRRLLHCRYTFDRYYWGEVSPNAKDFVERLIQLNPASRDTSSKALTHTWLNGAASKFRVLTSAAQSLKYINGRRNITLMTESPVVPTSADIKKPPPSYSMTKPDELQARSSWVTELSTLSSESRERLLNELTNAEPDATTCELIALLNSTDETCKNAVKDLHEGESVRHIKATKATVEQGSAIATAAAPTQTQPLYGESVFPEADCTTPLPGGGFVFDEPLPWKMRPQTAAAEPDVAADYSRVVQRSGLNTVTGVQDTFSVDAIDDGGNEEEEDGEKEEEEEDDDDDDDVLLPAVSVEFDRMNSYATDMLPVDVKLLERCLMHNVGVADVDEQLQADDCNNRPIMF